MYKIYFYKNRNNKEPVLDYIKELLNKIEQAKRELADLIERGFGHE